MKVGWVRIGDFRPIKVLCGYSWGFARDGASNESRVVENGDFRFFRSLYLPNLHI